MYCCANNDPVNWTDPDGRISTGFNRGVEGGSLNSSQSLAYNAGIVAGTGLRGAHSVVAHPIFDYIPPTAVAKRVGEAWSGHNYNLQPLTSGQRQEALVSAGMNAVPVGVFAKVASAGKQAVKALSNAGSAFEGTLYAPQKLQQLTAYLERRGIQVMETSGNPAFIARADRTGTMLLPSNPTALQVKHELSHYLDARNLGFNAYRDLGRAGREMSVLERLQGNRVWGTMNEAEKAFSINYATGIK